MQINSIINSIFRTEIKCFNNIAKKRARVWNVNYRTPWTVCLDKKKKLVWVNSLNGSMFILLSLNITMNRVGGASVIAKFQS